MCSSRPCVWNERNAEGESVQAPSPSKPCSVRRLRRLQPLTYRLEWRVLTIQDGDEFCDSRFETAVDPGDLRSFARSIGYAALGGEFLITAPNGEAVYTNIAHIECWNTLRRPLPDPYSAGQWLAEHELIVATDGIMSDVRKSLMRGVAKKLISLRHALLIIAALRSVTRRTVN